MYAGHANLSLRPRVNADARSSLTPHVNLMHTSPRGLRVEPGALRRAASLASRPSPCRFTAVPLPKNLGEGRGLASLAALSARDETGSRPGKPCGDERRVRDARP